MGPLLTCSKTWGPRFNIVKISSAVFFFNTTWNLFNYVLYLTKKYCALYLKVYIQILKSIAGRMEEVLTYSSK